MFSSQKTIVSIDLKGMIASGSRAPLNMDNLNGLFSKLMKIKFNALSIVINSPGGSPVQSSLIAQKIREISAKKKLSATVLLKMLLLLEGISLHVPPMKFMQMLIQ